MRGISSRATHVTPRDDSLWTRAAIGRALVHMRAVCVALCIAACVVCRGASTLMDCWTIYVLRAQSPPADHVGRRWVYAVERAVALDRL